MHIYVYSCTCIIKCILCWLATQISKLQISWCWRPRGSQGSWVGRPTTENMVAIKPWERSIRQYNSCSFPTVQLHILTITHCNHGRPCTTMPWKVSIGQKLNETPSAHRPYGLSSYHNHQVYWAQSIICLLIHVLCEHSSQLIKTLKERDNTRRYIATHLDNTPSDWQD